MTDLKKIADGLRRYNAWRRNNDEDLTLEMPNPKDLGVWIDSAIAVLEAHAENNDLARRVEVLEAALLEIADWTDLFARPGHPISKAARAAIAKSREIQSMEAGG